MINRRQFLKLTAATGAGLAVPWSISRSGSAPVGALRAAAIAAAEGLSNPVDQPKFAVDAPNALDPGYRMMPSRGGSFYTVGIAKNSNHVTGLAGGVTTPVWGYGQNGEALWPGKTFEVRKGRPIEVRWENNLFGEPHLLPVDPNVHWCYSLPGYEQYTIENDGVPIVTHLHGGHTLYLYDGNPEQFVSPGYKIRGPHWRGKTFIYQNDQDAGTLWYHDHALGITRLNVYAGLAGFFILRDELDTGQPDNPLGLPAFPYELAYAIQDRMFKANGELFYPAFPGDPFYEEFIETPLPEEFFPGGGPTALAEFFGDHMVVNGKIWPKAAVEPRNYRMRLLNGTDSRFLVIQFVAVDAGATDFASAGAPIQFWVIGSDQGLGSPAQTDTLVFEPGGRYDIVFDFKGLQGKRIIMKNIGGDAPFGGAFGNALEPDDLFPERQTDRIMAFDVADVSDILDAFNPANLPGYGGVANGATTRRVALFEGTDEFGRLQPLLGTVNSGDLNAPNVATALTWHQPTTENPNLGATEIWEIYNFTADAHPVHLHLVNFQILDRQSFEYEVTGTQTILQHNGATGAAPEISNIQNFAPVGVGPQYFEAAPKDMVTALPGDPEPSIGNPTGQVTRIKATFDRPGRYVWHCHILSHEDHEMMRVLHVGGGA